LRIITNPFTGHYYTLRGVSTIELRQNRLKDIALAPGIGIVQTQSHAQGPLNSTGSGYDPANPVFFQIITIHPYQLIVSRNTKTSHPSFPLIKPGKNRSNT
jgi:hypothetical protein